MVETASRQLRWHEDLAPGHERAGGALTIGRAGVNELARTYGTPALILDGNVLDATIAQFLHAARVHDMEIAYAGKALLLTGLVRLMAQTRLALDVCSLGELATAERGAMPASRMTLHGCGKTQAELEAAVAGRVDRTVVDNLDELAALAAHGKPVRVLLRINTGVTARTHSFVQTGGDDTKFGMTGRDFEGAANLLRANPCVAFLGLHSHIGSQIFETSAFEANAARLMDVAATFSAWGLPVKTLIAGGGFGVQTRPGETAPSDIADILDRIAVTVAKQARQNELPVPKIGLEPGRAIIAAAGTSLYRVMAKKQRTTHEFAVVDGGIADNPRPALYGAYHHAVLASRTSGAEKTRTVVCGRSCENDRMLELDLPEDLHAGDLLAVCTTGAYTYSMASNYNRFAKPAVVYVKDGQHRILARRETIEDVLRNDADA